MFPWFPPRARKHREFRLKWRVGLTIANRVRSRRAASIASDRRNRGVRAPDDRFIKDGPNRPRNGDHNSPAASSFHVDPAGSFADLVYVNFQKGFAYSAPVD